MSKLKVFNPSHKIPFEQLNMPKIFLAGDIDKNNNWREKIEIALRNTTNPVAIFNPQLPSGDHPKSNENLINQINWELTAQERADMVLFNFYDKNKTPASMVELGLFVNKAFIICSNDYYNKTFIDVIAKRYGLSVVTDFSKGLDILKQLIIEIPYQEILLPTSKGEKV